MNANESRALREQRAQIAKDMGDLRDAGLKTAEERTKFDALDTQQEELKQRIDRIEKVAGLGEELRGTGAPPNGQIGDLKEEDEEKVKAAAKKYEGAYSRYLRYGWTPKPHQNIRGLGVEDRTLLTQNRKSVELDANDLKELRDMGTGGGAAYPGSSTGFFIPVGFVYKILEAMKYYGPMLTEADTMNTSTGAPLLFPTDNDVNQMGEIVGENQQVTQSDILLGQIPFNAYKFSSKLVKVSIELMQDSAFAFDDFVTSKFAARLGRIKNKKFTTGTGVNEPTGIVTAAIAGGAYVNTIGTSVDDGTGAGTNTIGSDDMVELEHAIDPLYRPNSKYMFHDSTLKALKKVKDKYGRPLWLPNVALKAPDTINGYPFAINNDMDQLQTTTGPVTRNVALFGQLKMYMIRNVMDMNIIRLEERFADFGQVAFLAFSRADGNLLDAGTHPIAVLKSVY